MNVPENVTIPSKTLEKILNYLSTQPLGSVLDLFFEVKNAAEASYRAQTQGSPASSDTIKDIGL